MKKLIILSIIALIIIIAAAFGINYYLSFKKVTFTLSSSELTADIYKEGADTESGPTGQKKLAAIHGPSATISLQAGAYYVVPTSTNYSASHITFTVADKDLAVTVSPPYTDAYLSSLLTSKLTTIRSVLLSKYPQLKNFTYSNTGKLYLDGTWYGTTMVQNAQPGNNGDTYRTVLRYQNNTWAIVAAPALILTTADNPSIPTTIIHDLDLQTGGEANFMPYVVPTTDSE